ncbi:MAG TPA: hypothetical protein PLM10_02095 [Saccharofermentans sp.]|nr:hypothetical protein [Saccharofermentans sp.]
MGILSFGEKGTLMMNSILLSTKKTLGLSADYTIFDQDIIMHINTVFSIIHQLGIGPEEGFEITDADDVWTDFVSDVRLNTLRSYVYLRVRLLFDPPTTSYLLAAVQEQIKELEWRMNVYREAQNGPDALPLSYVIDGGTPHD